MYLQFPLLPLCLHTITWFTLYLLTFFFLSAYLVVVKHKGVSINYGRGGLKIDLAFLAIPPIKRKWNFAIPPFRRVRFGDPSHGFVSPPLP